MNRRQGNSLQQRPTPSEQRRSRRVLHVVMLIAALSIFLGVWWGMMMSKGSTPSPSPSITDEHHTQQSEGDTTTISHQQQQQQHVDAPISPNLNKRTSISTNTRKGGGASKKDRTPSDPFITGDLYRDLASIIIDETTVSTSSLSLWGGGGGKGLAGGCQPQQRASEGTVPGGGVGAVDGIAAGFIKRGLVAPPTDVSNILSKLKEAVHHPATSTTAHHHHNTTVFVQTHLMGFFVRCLLPRVEIAAKEVVDGGGGSGGGRLIILTHNSDYSTPYTPTNSRLKGGYQALSRALTSTSSSAAAGAIGGSTDSSSSFGGTSALLTYFGDGLKGVVQMDGVARGGGVVLGLRSPLITWYGQNLIIRDTGGLSNYIKPLPIGIENRYNKLGRHVGIYEEMARAAPPFADRKKTLLVSFSLKTNPLERKAARDAAEKLATALLKDDTTKQGAQYGGMSVTFYHQPAASKGSAATTPEDALRGFLRQLSEHQFVLAPKGHGVDTHRIWEAMYMGCVPIALDSPSFDFPPLPAFLGDSVGDGDRMIFGESFAHPSLPLWVLPNPFLPSSPHHHHSSPKAGGGEGVTSTTEGGVYSKYLTPTSLRSAQLYYSKLLSRKEAGDDDALSWLLAKFPILSTSYWRSKFEKGK